jgi:hypothetical protein
LVQYDSENTNGEEGGCGWLVDSSKSVLLVGRSSHFFEFFINTLFNKRLEIFVISGTNVTKKVHNIFQKVKDKVLLVDY